MARTAEASAGEAVKDGSHKLRKRAREVGKAGADFAAQAAQVAEQRLTEGTEAARKELGKTSRRTRRKLAHQAKRTSKEVSKSTKQAKKVAAERAGDMRAPGRKARKAAIQAAKSAGHSKRKAKHDFKQAKKDFKSAVADAKTAAKGEKKKRRKLPWLLGLGALAAAVAYALRSKQEPPIAPAPPRSTDAPKPAEPPASKAGEPQEPKPGAPRNGQQAKNTEQKKS
ncbi:hypothetical protein ABZ639_15030 [Saccharomonospora sp. NPDC006951]